MELITDGEYLLAKQDDGNTVVYRNGIPVWDKWTYEASHGVSTPAPSIPSSLVMNMVAKNINPIGMSYWRNINQHKGQDILKLFLSINDEITIFTIEKSTLNVLGEQQIGVHHTGEGCHFSAVRSNILYIPTDNNLIAFDINTNQKEIEWAVSGKYLWQCHTSYDDSMHSATIKDLGYNIIKWAVFGALGYKEYDIKGEPDECQIDKSGKWLTIKEDNYNRIINIQSGEEKIIQNEAGALGHSDCGFECMLGENDYSDRAGALDLIDLNSLESRLMYSTGIWNMGYVSFTNAKPGPLENQFCLVSTSLELIKVKLDGSGTGIKICDNLTESQEYNNRPKANLCPEGEFAAWTSFVDGTLNAYIVRV